MIHESRNQAKCLLWVTTTATITKSKILHVTSPPISHSKAATAHMCSLCLPQQTDLLPCGLLLLDHRRCGNEAWHLSPRVKKQPGCMLPQLSRGQARLAFNVYFLADHGEAGMVTCLLFPSRRSSDGHACWVAARGES